MSSSYMAFASARILLRTTAIGVSVAKARKELLHAIDRPEQVDGRRPRARQPLANRLKLRGKLSGRLRLRLLRTQRDAISGRHANRWSPADDHRHDHVGNLFVGGGEHVALLEGKLGLIDETDAFRGPCKCRNHALPVYREAHPSPLSPHSGCPRSLALGDRGELVSISHENLYIFRWTCPRHGA